MPNLQSILDSVSKRRFGIGLAIAVIALLLYLLDVLHWRPTNEDISDVILSACLVALAAFVIGASGIALLLVIFQQDQWWGEAEGYIFELGIGSILAVGISVYGLVEIVHIESELSQLICKTEITGDLSLEATIKGNESWIKFEATPIFGFTSGDTLDVRIADESVGHIKLHEVIDGRSTKISGELTVSRADLPKIGTGSTMLVGPLGCELKANTANQ